MKALGTILPHTGAQAAAIDRVWDDIRRKALALAAIELAGLEKRTVGGEVRYYKSPTIYALAIKSGGVRRWFEVRADGDYSITQ